MKYLKLSLILTCLCLVIILSLFIYSVETKSIEIKEYNVNELFDLDNVEITFVQISDLHIKSFGNFEKRIADEIIKIKPDFILFTGDMIDNTKRYF